MARDPIFLERKSYRQRRLMDAVRLLPLLGLALWMVPLMWTGPQETGEPTPIGAALRYIFGVWIVMVLAGWALWWRTKARAPSGESATKDAP